LQENYRKSAFFNEIFPQIQALYDRPCVLLADFNRASIELLLGLFDIRIEILLASSLAPRERSNELLVEILGKVGADRYLSGVGAKAYFQPEPFETAGIEVIWQDFQHPVYPQLHGDFVSHLSSIDLLFNCGIVRSREILRKH
jgi:hypothetical protein